MSCRTGRFIVVSFLVVLGLILIPLGWAAPALAGGWSVITLDELPDQVAAGKSFEIGFTVLQHGRNETPATKLSPSVKAVPLAGGKPLTFSAHEDKVAPGHYTAKLMLPQSGEWEWSIQAFNRDQPMPTLTVAIGPSTAASALSPRLLAPLIMGSLGLLGFAGGLALTFRRRSTWFGALALAGLGLAALGFGLWVTQTQAQAQASSVVAVSYLSPAQVGHDLFIAKGCVSCHLNGRIEAKYVSFSTETGPNLTNHPLGADYLRLWLKDPRAVKPATEMPTLRLSPAEIEALIAFLGTP